MVDEPPRFPTAADVFATEYGLLGLFHHGYSAPILPERKLYISPEAVIEDGRLVHLDPTNDGLELVVKTVDGSRPSGGKRSINEEQAVVAMPEEVRFATKERFRYPDDPSGRPLVGRELDSWEEARRPYDAVFVFDPARQAKSSILARSENIFAWRSVLQDYPAPPYTVDRFPYLARVLNEALVDASPAITLGGARRLKQAWRCNSLLQAMYLMLWQDLINSSELRECASHDCATYFRVGPQTDSKYCSMKHADRASTRMWRGQTP